MNWHENLLLEGVNQQNISYILDDLLFTEQPSLKRAMNNYFADKIIKKAQAIEVPNEIFVEQDNSIDANIDIPKVSNKNYKFILSLIEKGYRIPLIIDKYKEKFGNKLSATDISKLIGNVRKKYKIINSGKKLKPQLKRLGQDPKVIQEVVDGCLSGESVNNLAKRIYTDSLGNEGNLGWNTINRIISRNVENKKDRINAIKYKIWEMANLLYKKNRNSGSFYDYMKSLPQSERISLINKIMDQMFIPPEDRALARKFLAEKIDIRDTIPKLRKNERVTDNPESYVETDFLMDR